MPRSVGANYMVLAFPQTEFPVKPSVDPPRPHCMNSWYYSQADQAVGPFQMEVLGKLVQAGVIDDATPVRKADETEWQPLATVLARDIPPAPSPVQSEASYYYLDASDQPVGPFEVATIQRLHSEGVVRADTLVSRIGDPEWTPAAPLLKFAARPVLVAAPSTGVTALVGHPRYRPFVDYVTMMVTTLSLYSFYLVPSQSRDLKAITGKPRMEFTPLLILGIVTFGLVPLVMMALWASDLEKHGKVLEKAGRRDSLGTHVLSLNVFCVVANFGIQSFIPAFIVSGFLSGTALWLLQKEINLYANAPKGVTGT